MSPLIRSTSKPRSFEWHAWFRPMFAASLVLHGVVLSVPILSEPEPPPEAEEELVELTQLPPLVSLKTPPAPQPKPIASAPAPVQQAVSAPPRPQAPPPVRPSAPPPVSPASPAPVIEESAEAAQSEVAALSAEDQELQDYFAQFQGDLQGVAANETAGLSIPYYLFASPQLFFTAESLAVAEADPTAPATPVEGIDNILWASRRRPADLLTELQTRFEGFTFNQVDSFGGGDLYKLEKGSTVRYLNLVRATDRTATFVVIWNRDPSQPAPVAEQSAIP
jgi:hypothetical protein